MRVRIRAGVTSSSTGGTVHLGNSNASQVVPRAASPHCLWVCARCHKGRGSAGVMGTSPLPRGYMPSHKWCLDLISGRFGKKNKILFVATRKSQRGAPRPRLAPWLHRVALLGSILRSERQGGGGAARAITSPIPSAGQRSSGSRPVMNGVPGCHSCFLPKSW